MIHLTNEFIIEDNISKMNLIDFNDEFVNKRNLIDFNDEFIIDELIHRINLLMKLIY